MVNWLNFFQVFLSNPSGLSSLLPDDVPVAESLSALLISGIPIGILLSSYFTLRGFTGPDPGGFGVIVFFVLVFILPVLAVLAWAVALGVLVTVYQSVLKLLGSRWSVSGHLLFACLLSFLAGLVLILFRFSSLSVVKRQLAVYVPGAILAGLAVAFIAVRAFQSLISLHQVSALRVAFFTLVPILLFGSMLEFQLGIKPSSESRPQERFADVLESDLHAVYYGTLEDENGNAILRPHFVGVYSLTPLNESFPGYKSQDWPPTEFRGSNHSDFSLGCQDSALCPGLLQAYPDHLDVQKYDYAFAVVCGNRNSTLSPKYCVGIGSTSETAAQACVSTCKLVLPPVHPPGALDWFGYVYL